jgi:hypothetical protein
MRQRWRYRRFILLLLVLTVAFAGCTTVSYKVPIGNYKEANTLVIENTRTIIKQANQVERKIYVDKQVRQHLRIDMDGIHNVELFSQDQLAARMKALDTIDAYGTLLLKIVNSDAPQSIAETSGTVSKDVTNLLGMMAKLQGKNDTAFKNAADPVAKIVSQVVGLAMDQKIQAALNKAVEAGYEPMNGLITLLNEETYGVYQRKRTQLLQKQKSLLEAYNAELQKGKSLNEDVLKKDAEQIKVALDNWEASAEANPDLMFDAMAKAQQALLAYTRSNKTQKDTDEFSYAMSDYLARVKQVGASIKNLSQF